MFFDKTKNTFEGLGFLILELAYKKQLRIFVTDPNEGTIDLPKAMQVLENQINYIIEDISPLYSKKDQPEVLAISIRKERGEFSDNELRALFKQLISLNINLKVSEIDSQPVDEKLGTLLNSVSNLGYDGP